LGDIEVVMLLAIDIGNTKIALGVFEQEELRTSWHIQSEMHKMADEYAVLLLNLLAQEGLKAPDITHAALCSVVPPLVPTFEKLCQRYFGFLPLVVEAGVKTGVRILMDNPREVGSDRVANAAAAFRLYGGPTIVIDFGTATTFDVISQGGDYLGGAIAPGMEIAAEALFTRTAKLPRVDIAYPKHAIGSNTVTAIQSGITFGYVGLIEGITNRIRHELGGKAKIIATGSYAEVIAEETPIIEAINPQLTMIGLRLIHKLHRGS
jgi:type III pantothenate kinase